MYVFDTNICIYILNDHPISLLSKFNKFKNKICISTIVYAELYYGVQNTGSVALRNERMNELQEFCSLIEIDDWTEEAAERYGNIRALLKNSGQMIGNMDLLIAAYVMSSRKILITNNEQEFQRIPGLMIENWTK